MKSKGLLNAVVIGHVVFFRWPVIRVEHYDYWKKELPGRELLLECLEKTSPPMA